MVAGLDADAMLEPGVGGYSGTSESRGVGTSVDEDVWRGRSRNESARLDAFGETKVALLLTEGRGAKGGSGPVDSSA